MNLTFFRERSSILVVVNVAMDKCEDGENACPELYEPSGARS